jgi:hypothetical protein
MGHVHPASRQAIAEPSFAALPELPTISASADDAANGDRASGDGANEDGATGLASSFVQRLWGLGLLATRLLRFWEER